jgi:hypothetical protein
MASMKLKWQYFPHNPLFSSSNKFNPEMETGFFREQRK